MISKSLRKYLGPLPFNYNHDQVRSVGELEHASIPYIITEDFPSHQTLNGHIIVEVSPQVMIPKPTVEQIKEEHAYSREAHEYFNSKGSAPLNLDVPSLTSLN